METERMMEIQKEMDVYWLKKDLNENIEICDEQIDKHRTEMKNWTKIKRTFEKEIRQL